MQFYIGGQLGKFSQFNMKHICEGCKDEFRDKSALLRHVSHRKSCKEHYGAMRLMQMRYQGKLVAKRKWWKNNGPKKTKSDSTMTKKAAKCTSKEVMKQKYVSQDERRNTEKGKAFTKFYFYVYFERKVAALKQLEEFAYDKFYKDAEEEAIDLTFETDDWVTAFNENAGPGYSWVNKNEWLRELEYDEDYPFDEEFEPAFKKVFDKYFEKEIVQRIDSWLDTVDNRIYSKCKKQGENTAFAHFYEEFCSNLYNKIQTGTLDKVFDLIEEDAISEHKLDQNYSRIFNDLLEDASVSSELADKLSKKLDPKIEKQVRFMKGM